MANTQRKIKCEGGVLSVEPPPDVSNLKSLGSILFEKLAENGNSLNQIYGISGEKETWNQLLTMCVRLAIAMRSRGITPNDIVLSCNMNYPVSTDIFISSQFVGAKLVNVHPKMPLSDMVFILKQVQPKIIFVDSDDIKYMEDAMGEANIRHKTNTLVIVFGTTLKYYTFAGFGLPSPEEKRFVPAEVQDLDETALITYKKYGAGAPVGICFSHRALLALKLNNEKIQTFKKRVLCFTSFYNISAISACLFSVLGGFTRVIHPLFEADYIWQLIRDNDVDMVLLNANQAIAVCKKGRPTDRDTSTLTYVLIDGGPISKEQMLEIRQVFSGAVVETRYGIDELADNGLEWNTDEENVRLSQERPEAVGRPTQGLQYKVVDPNTEEILGTNQQGELRIKTEFKMSGYYKLDSSALYDSDGFYKTGIIAYYDADYCFYIVDNIKDMLKYQSWRIVPAKLEAVLLMHPAVEEAVVVGVSTSENEDHPMGVVVLKEAHAEVIGEELEKYVEERVDDREKLKGGVRIVKSMPIDPSDKYNRMYIKNKVLQTES